MIELIIGGIMVGLLGIMVWQLRTLGTDSAHDVDKLNERFVPIQHRLDSINDVLCDLADIAEQAPVTAMESLAQPAAPQTIGEAITTALLERVLGGLGHATSSEREIYPQETETQEVYNDSNGETSESEI